jgi:hypothetical protein
LNQQLEALATANVSFNVDSSGTMGSVEYNANVSTASTVTSLTPAVDTMLYIYPFVQLYNVTTDPLSTDDKNAIIAAMALCFDVDPSNVSIQYVSGQFVGDKDYAFALYFNVSINADSQAAAESLYYTLSPQFTATLFNTNLATTRETYQASDLYGAYSPFVTINYWYIDDPTYSYRVMPTSYFSKQMYEWSTMDGWLQDGYISVHSASLWSTLANWAVVGEFSYGSDIYKIAVKETNFDSASTNLFVAGAGTYGGDWEAW